MTRPSTITEVIPLNPTLLFAAENADSLPIPVCPLRICSRNVSSAVRTAPAHWRFSKNVSRNGISAFSILKRRSGSPTLMSLRNWWHRTAESLFYTGPQYSKNWKTVCYNRFLSGIFKLPTILHLYGEKTACIKMSTKNFLLFCQAPDTYCYLTNH